MASRLDEIVPLHQADVAYPAWHPRAGETGPVYAFAVRTEDGAVLFDTGLGPPHPLIDELYRPSRRELASLLAGAGIDPASVRRIVCSHLHFDHAGANPAFAGVPIVVQRAEREAARAPRYTVPEFVEFPGARYEVLDGDADLGGGIRVLATPGHTPGHQSLAVETEEGNVVLAGQAAETLADFERDAAEDENLRRLLSLSPARVHFSHDHAVWTAPAPNQ
jgi:glyoxylase-like metal-dependent hydrolase (beta-lactamase superfamily II)